MLEILLRDPFPFVPHVNADKFAFAGVLSVGWSHVGAINSHCDLSPVGHRLGGVHNQVGQDLLDLPDVDPGRGGCFLLG